MAAKKKAKKGASYWGGSPGEGQGTTKTFVRARAKKHATKKKAAKKKK